MQNIGLRLFVSFFALAASVSEGEEPVTTVPPGQKSTVSTDGTDAEAAKAATISLESIRVHLAPLTDSRSSDTPKPSVAPADVAAQAVEKEINLRVEVRIGRLVLGSTSVSGKSWEKALKDGVGVNSLKGSVPPEKASQLSVVLSLSLKDGEMLPDDFLDWRDDKRQVRNVEGVDAEKSTFQLFDLTPQGTNPKDAGAKGELGVAGKAGTASGDRNSSRAYQLSDAPPLPESKGESVSSIRIKSEIKTPSGKDTGLTFELLHPESGTVISSKRIEKPLDWYDLRKGTVELGTSRVTSDVTNKFLLRVRADKSLSAAIKLTAVGKVGDIEGTILDDREGTNSEKVKSVIENKIGDAKKAKDKHEKELEEPEAELKSKNGDLKTKKEEIEKENEALEPEQDELSADKKERFFLKIEIGAGEPSDDQKQKLEKLEQRIAALTIVIDKRTTAIATLSSEISTLEKEITDLSTKVDDLNQAIVDDASAINRWNRFLRSLWSPEKSTDLLWRPDQLSPAPDPPKKKN